MCLLVGTSFATHCKISRNPAINRKEGDTVTKEEVCTQMKDENVLFIDVRSPREFESTPKINAENWMNLILSDLDPWFPVDVHPLDMDEESFLEKYDHAKPAKDAAIIIYCRSGARSSRALEIFRQYGFTNAKHFPGSAGYWKCLKKEGFCQN